jgi:YhcG PDDEXK nuclease domain
MISLLLRGRSAFAPAMNGIVSISSFSTENCGVWVVVDLKIGKFTHADAGQMNLYLNYAREHWTPPEENPPVGLILCSEKDAAVAHYALGNLTNKVLAREYQITLPKERELRQRLKRVRALLTK